MRDTQELSLWRLLYVSLAPYFHITLPFLVDPYTNFHAVYSNPDSACLVLACCGLSEFTSGDVNLLNCAETFFSVNAILELFIVSLQSVLQLSKTGRQQYLRTTLNIRFQQTFSIALFHKHSLPLRKSILGKFYIIQYVAFYLQLKCYKNSGRPPNKLT